jgi:acyl-CoA thioesterase I
MRNLLMILSFLIITGCSKTPSLPILAEDAKIVAFGDELTAAPHLTTEQTYPALLAKQLKRSVINAGVTGETLAQAVKRFPQMLETEKPALVIICHGGYAIDPTNEAANTQTLEYFRQMLGLARAKKISVVLIGIPEKQPPYFAPADFYKRLARAFEIPYHGAILSKVLPNIQMMDTEHHLPNPQGYQLVTDGVIEILKESKAIP